MIDSLNNYVPNKVVRHSSEKLECTFCCNYDNNFLLKCSYCSINYHKTTCGSDTLNYCNNCFYLLEMLQKLAKLKLEKKYLKGCLEKSYDISKNNNNSKTEISKVNISGLNNIQNNSYVQNTYNNDLPIVSSTSGINQFPETQKCSENKVKEIPGKPFKYDLNDFPAEYRHYVHDIKFEIPFIPNFLKDNITYKPIRVKENNTFIIIGYYTEYLEKQTKSSQDSLDKNQNSVPNNKLDFEKQLNSNISLNFEYNNFENICIPQSPEIKKSKYNSEQTEKTNLTVLEDESIENNLKFPEKSNELLQNKFCSKIYTKKKKTVQKKRIKFKFLTKYKQIRVKKFSKMTDKKHKLSHIEKPKIKNNLTGSILNKYKIKNKIHKLKLKFKENIKSINLNKISCKLKEKIRQYKVTSNQKINENTANNNNNLHQYSGANIVVSWCHIQNNVDPTAIQVSDTSQKQFDSPENFIKSQNIDFKCLKSIKTEYLTKRSAVQENLMDQNYMLPHAIAKNVTQFFKNINVILLLFWTVILILNSILQCHKQQKSIFIPVLDTGQIITKDKIQKHQKYFDNASMKIFEHKGAYIKLLYLLKEILNILLDEHAPREHTFISFMYQAKHIYNSRLLTEILLVRLAQEILTHFVLGPPDYKIADILYRREFNACSKQLDITHNLSKNFNNQYNQENILSINLKKKWPNKCILKIWDVVVILDGNKITKSFVESIIAEIFKANDKQYHFANVDTATSVFKRPAVKIAVLDIKSNSEVPTPVDSLPDATLNETHTIGSSITDTKTNPVVNSQTQITTTSTLKPNQKSRRMQSCQTTSCKQFSLMFKFALMTNTLDTKFENLNKFGLFMAHEQQIVATQHTGTGEIMDTPLKHVCVDQISKSCFNPKDNEVKITNEIIIINNNVFMTNQEDSNCIILAFFNELREKIHCNEVTTLPEQNTVIIPLPKHHQYIFYTSEPTSISLNCKRSNEKRTLDPIVNKTQKFTTEMINVEPGCVIYSQGQFIVSITEDQLVQRFQDCFLNRLPYQTLLLPIHLMLTCYHVLWSQPRNHFQLNCIITT